MLLLCGTAVRVCSTTTVTAIGKKGTPPEFKQEDVKLYQGKEQMQVANWRRGESLLCRADRRLSRSAVASNFNDLKAFFQRAAAFDVHRGGLQPQMAWLRSCRILPTITRLRASRCGCPSVPGGPSPARIFPCRIG